MASKFQEYKAVASKVKLVIDVPNALLENAVFVGLSYGLFIGEQIVIALPFLPKKANDMTEYHSNLRLTLMRHGDVKKVALYQDNRTGMIFALPQHKSRSYRLDSLFYLRCGKPLHKERITEQCVKIFHEEKNHTHVCGVFDVLKGNFTFNHFPIFNSKLLSEEILFDLIPLSVFLGTGHYIDGFSSVANKSNERYFVPNYLPKHLHFLKPIPQFKYHKDSLIRLRSNGAFSNNECVYMFNRFVKKTIRTGDALDLDWFGREFGFFVKNEDGFTCRFYTGSHTDKGFNYPLNELEH